MPVEAMGAVAPLPWTWTIHPSALTTATLTAARFAGFEPSAVLIVTTAGSAGRGPVLLRSKAMALAIASRWGLPSQEPTRPAQCLSPSVEGKCRPSLAERSVWGSPIAEAWRSDLALRSPPRPMASSTATCSASCPVSCLALLRSPLRQSAMSSTAAWSASCLASPHLDRSYPARHPCSPRYPCLLEQGAPFRSGCRAEHYLTSDSPLLAPVHPAGSLFPAGSQLPAGSRLAA